MTENFTSGVIAGFLAQSGWEIAAVILAIAYLLLAMRQNSLCWYAAFVSTSIFLVIFWQVGLVMESALQVYYLVMAAYGWWRWQAPADAGGLAVTSWGTRQHVLAIGSILALTAGSGFVLTSLLPGLGAQMPVLDSFTTWGAVITTWMVATKVLENWLYWIVIDAVAIYLYLDRELYFTAVLFVAYVVIATFGWFAWRKNLSKSR